MATNSEIKRTIIVETFLAFNQAMGLCNDDPRVAEIVQYINTCSDAELDNFIGCCQGFYRANPHFMDNN